MRFARRFVWQLTIALFALMSFVSTAAAQTQPPNAPPPAQVPVALPKAGDADSSNIAVISTVLGLALAGAGLGLRRTSTKPR